MAKKKKKKSKSRPRPKAKKAKKSVRKVALDSFPKESLRIGDSYGAAKKKTTKKKSSHKPAKKKKKRTAEKIIVAKKVSKKPKRLKIKEVKIDVRKTVADIMSILPQTEPPSEGLCMKLCPKCNVDGFYGVCRMEHGHIVSHRCDRCFNEWI